MSLTKAILEAVDEAKLHPSGGLTPNYVTYKQVADVVKDSGFEFHETYTTQGSPFSSKPTKVWAFTHPDVEEAFGPGNTYLRVYMKPGAGAHSPVVGVSIQSGGAGITTHRSGDSDDLLDWIGEGLTFVVDHANVFTKPKEPTGPTIDQAHELLERGGWEKNNKYGAGGYMVDVYRHPAVAGASLHVGYSEHADGALQYVVTFIEGDAKEYPPSLKVLQDIAAGLVGEGGVNEAKLHPSKWLGPKLPTVKEVLGTLQDLGWYVGDWGEDEDGDYVRTLFHPLLDHEYQFRVTEFYDQDAKVKATNKVKTVVADYSGGGDYETQFTPAHLKDTTEYMLETHGKAPGHEEMMNAVLAASKAWVKDHTKPVSQDNPIFVTTEGLDPETKHAVQNVVFNSPGAKSYSGHHMASTTWPSGTAYEVFAKAAVKWLGDLEAIVGDKPPKYEEVEDALKSKGWYNDPDDPADVPGGDVAFIRRWYMNDAVEANKKDVRIAVTYKAGSPGYGEIKKVEAVVGDPAFFGGALYHAEVPVNLKDILAQAAKFEAEYAEEPKGLTEPVYALTDQMQKKLVWTAWLTARQDELAPISKDNPILVIVRDETDHDTKNFPERKDVEYYVEKTALAHAFNEDLDAVEVWPGDTQTPAEFNQDVRWLVNITEINLGPKAVGDGGVTLDTGMKVMVQKTPWLSMPDPNSPMGPTNLVHLRVPKGLDPRTVEKQLQLTDVLYNWKKKYGAWEVVPRGGQTSKAFNAEMFNLVKRLYELAGPGGAKKAHTFPISQVNVQTMEALNKKTTLPFVVGPVDNDLGKPNLNMVVLLGRLLGVDHVTKLMKASMQGRLFAGLKHLDDTWHDQFEGWEVRPAEGASPGEFNNHLAHMLSRADDVLNEIGKK